MTNKPHYTIGEMARQAGVSIRTLRHYDAIGLLQPSHRGDNNYRYYTVADSQRLFDILFYRALGFALSEIEALLSQPQKDRQQQLRKQRKELDAHIDRLQGIRRQLDALLDDSAKSTVSNKEQSAMGKDNQFNVFDGFDPDQYADEAKERWGHTDAYKESTRRTKNYTQEDWARYKAEADALNQAMVQLIKRNLSPDDPEVLDVVDQMRRMIDKWFYPCPPKMHAGLGEMYVQDGRFAAYYEKIHPGMAKFMRDATAANSQK